MSVDDVSCKFVANRRLPYKLFPSASEPSESSESS